MSGVSSYPRTRGTYVSPEVIRALLAQGYISEEDVQGYNESLLGTPDSGREMIKEVVQVLLKDRRADVAFLDKINAGILQKQFAAATDGKPAPVTVYHHSGARNLNGFSYQSVPYTKKLDRALYKRERYDFDRKERALWLRDVGVTHAQALRSAGIPQREIDRMVDVGKPPDGYQVHHRLPLDDGGTNSPDNFILIKDDVEHRALHGYYNPAELRIRHLAHGETATVALAVPPKDTVIYPDPSKGYVSNPVGFSVFMEMFDEH